jgi:hypothetical protein
MIFVLTLQRKVEIGASGICQEKVRWRLMSTAILLSQACYTAQDGRTIVFQMTMWLLQGCSQEITGQFIPSRLAISDTAFLLAPKCTEFKSWCPHFLETRPRVGLGGNMCRNGQVEALLIGLTETSLRTRNLFRWWQALKLQVCLWCLYFRASGAE